MNFFVDRHKNRVVDIGLKALLFYVEVLSRFLLHDYDHVNSYDRVKACNDNA